ncbi:MAG: PBP1A family penicillin-binding protein [Patescibacteria group bacterium]
MLNDRLTSRFLAGLSLIAIASILAFSIADSAVAVMFPGSENARPWLALVLIGCGIAATLLSARREVWSPTVRWLLFSFRAAWVVALLLVICAIAAVAHEAVGDEAVTAAVAAVMLIAAYGVGWPRLAMPAAEPPPRWWSLKRHFAPSRILACILFVFASLLAGIMVADYPMLARQLPSDLGKLVNYEPMKATRVLSSEGDVIGEFFLEKRIIVGLDAIPTQVRQAFVAAEDERFYRHHGIDKWAILRAAETDLRVKVVGKGRIVGGSTITQQVAKQLLVGSDRDLIRKILEAIMDRRMERELSKDDILGIYLNHVFLGNNAYGLAAAADIYFDKTVDKLTLAEGAMIAGLPPAPSAYSPVVDYDKARVRQIYVLSRMVANGFLTPAQAEAAKAEPIALASKKISINATAAPYFVEFVHQRLLSRYGDKGFYLHGLTIKTTLSMSAQRYAELAVRRGLDALDLRLGFRGPIDHFEDEKAERFRANPPSSYPDGKVSGAATLSVQPGRVYQGMVTVRTPQSVRLAIGKEEFILAAVDMPRLADWDRRFFESKIRPGDVMNVRLKQVRLKKGSGENTELRAFLTQQPKVQAAMIVLDPATGHLLAMVGGYDFGISQYNRTVPDKKGRQAGSAIKPLVYSAAIESGMRETDIMEDAPYSKPSASGIPWSPVNYTHKYAGRVTLRQAIAQSLNTVSCRLTDKVGIDPVIETMRRLGIEKFPIPRVTPIAIGAVDTTLLELSYAFATFPSGGMEVTPDFIEQITDAKGRVIFDARHDGSQPKIRQRMDPANAYIVLDLMKGVVENGTAHKARALGRPVAGKTGTTNDYKDAWFIGFTADLLAGVWVGRDDAKTIGEDITGGSAALPIWLEFMQNAHPDTPPRDFAVPPGIVFARGDIRSGLPHTASASGSALIPYRRGSMPDAPKARPAVPSSIVEAAPTDESEESKSPVE